jgi:signal transduction histidine kinase
MRPSIKTKQVAGVTAIVGLAVMLLSGLYLSWLVRIELEDSQERASLIASVALDRAFQVVSGLPSPQADVRQALQDDQGLRDALNWSIYGKGVVYAAMVGRDRVVLAHTEPSSVGKVLPAQADLAALLAAGPIAQLRAIYEPGGLLLEVSQPFAIGGVTFGAVHVGVSTLLIQRDLTDKLKQDGYAVAIAMLAAIIVAMLLAQVMLRPIHLIRSSLSRLGRGESGGDVEWAHEPELADVGASIDTLGAQLSAGRTEIAGQRATLASVVEHLEEAVAVVDPHGDVLFANPAMRAVFEPSPVSKRVRDVLPEGHPYRAIVEATLRERTAQGPITALVPTAGGAAAGDAAANDRLMLTHVIEDPRRQLLGVMLVARNLGYLSHVQSTLNYSRKLAALGRLSAGIAHEVKNPLNATAIHLELLRQRLADARAAVDASGGSAATDLSAAMEHLSIIDAEMRRLDGVVQGFLRFTRAEEPKLEPVRLAALLEDLMPVIAAEAEKRGVDVRLACPRDLSMVNGDAGLLQQAFLNLALNACQAMPHGGVLRITGAMTRAGDVELRFEDTGVGIPPEHLDKIFDLYFTTKDEGSGMGLSLVYRTMQLHDGDVEVESTPGRGTTFRLLFRAI